MFDDMFDTQEEILSGTKQGAVLSSWERKPKNCADLLPLPQKQRKKGYPIGLKNQGATCYLNSFLQILFHTPELRKTILDLPLCKGDVQTKSDFVKQAQHRFLFGFQKLFSQMSLRDTFAVDTDYLNKAFGWEGKEHVEQQDMTEAMKIIFDTMERALFGTSFEDSTRNLFKGTIGRYKTCQACTVRSERDEDFYDFVVQVSNMKSLNESLLASLTPQVMEGDNKIFCDVCQAKQDMWLGTRFKTFPNILVFTLNRFAFDYETFNRVKVNSYFEFDLEEKLTHLVDEGKEEEFELYGVIVHRGSAHGGHYFCYIRDVLQESNWGKSIEEAHNQQEKRQKEKVSESSSMSEQQKKKKQQLQKQDKQYKLKEPQNKSLLQNWYQLNDSMATAIDAQKLTSKYEGSQSAYILFYRRKGTPAHSLDIKVPSYLSTLIQQQNTKVRQQRAHYQSQKQHIILNINGSQEKLNIKMKVKDLLEKYCPDECFALVMEAEHNGLSYYPMELNQVEREFGQEDTIEKHQIYHQSTWKTYLITDDQYLKIKGCIGKEKLPFEVNCIFNEQKQKLVLHQDQTLSQLRQHLQRQLSVPYQNQIIQLVTPYKQLFLTDKLENDQLLLTKLGFIHQCQIIVKNLSPESENYEELLNEEMKEKIDKDLICFVVERDDQIGIKKFYFSKYQTLEALLHFIVKLQSLDSHENKRLRNLNGNRLYYIDHYTKQLLELDLTEEIVKLRIERGEIPVKGDIAVKTKLQSKLQTVEQDTVIQKIFDPNTTILQLKQAICQQTNLNPQLHRLYLTDWMGQPVRSITKESQSIFQANFSREEIICIRDLQSPIGSELLHFQIFVTETGSPDNISSDSFHFKTQIHKTVLQFKENLLNEPYFKEKSLKPKQLRIRQLKRDYMFGTVWRSHDRLMKDIQTNTNKLVLQVMKQEEQLKEDQIVLTLKQRDMSKRNYEGSMQLVFEAGKEPKVADLTEAVRQKLLLSPQFPLMIIKYFNYNFEWVEVSEENLQKQSKKKEKPQGNKNKNQKGNNDKNQENKGKKNKAENKNEKNQAKKNKGEKKSKQQEQKKQTNKQDVQQHPNKTQEPQQKPQSQQSKQQQSQSKPQSIPSQPKKQAKKKQPNPQQPTIPKTDHLNLRKPPTLLKDGDWIGWGNSQEILRSKDDLQTDEDLSLRLIKKSNKNPNAVYRRNQGAGFKINVDF